MEAVTPSAGEISTNSAQVNQSAAELSNLADKLSLMVDQFKVRSNFTSGRGFGMAAAAGGRRRRYADKSGLQLEAGDDIIQIMGQVIQLFSTLIHLTAAIGNSIRCLVYRADIFGDKL